LSFGVNLCFIFDTRGNTKTASGKHYMDFCFSLDDLLSASRKHKTQPSFSPANFVFVQSTVAKPKTKSYTVKKVDRKVFLTTPQHGKNRSVSNNSVFFDEATRKIEFLRGISRKSRDFSLPKSRFFEKFQVITRFFETSPQKNMLLEIDLFFWARIKFCRLMLFQRQLFNLVFGPVHIL
jgi:hypothetical protein